MLGKYGLHSLYFWKVGSNVWEYWHSFALNYGLFLIKPRLDYKKYINVELHLKHIVIERSLYRNVISYCLALWYNEKYFGAYLFAFNCRYKHNFQLVKQ
jgi:hypothetical protein